MAERRYLNNAERDICYIAGSMKAWSHSTAEKLLKYPQRKAVVKNLRAAGTFADKALEEMLRPLDIKERAYVTAESTKVKVITKYKDSALRELKEVEKLNDTVKIPKDAFFTVVEFCVAGYCKRCKLRGAANISKCALRNTLMEQGVEPLNCYADENTCQYQDYEETAVEAAFVNALMGDDENG